MSIDSIYSKFKPNDLSYDPDFQPEDSVISARRFTSPGAQNMSVIMPPWHAPDWLIKRMARKEQKLGRNVLFYALDDRILSSNIDRTLESFAVVAKRAKQDVEWSNADRIRWVGSSLGCAVLMRAVGGEKLPADEIVLNAPGGDLAESVSTSVATRPIWQQIFAQGVDLAELKQDWRELAPTHQASRISGAHVSMRVSMADEVIRPETAYELADTLSERNEVSLDLDRHLGHYLRVLASAA